MDSRLEKIVGIILREKKVSVGDLSRRLGVSEVTVRKDLTILENRGRVLRRYGGAVPAENPGQVVPHLKKIFLMEEEKRRIAETAAALVQDGENILLDAGSTTLALARKIRGRGLRVVTNSLAAAEELIADEKTVVELIGGTLRKASGALIGPRACRELETIRVDKVFLGASGFDPKLGFSSENAVEAETKEKMLKCGKEAFVLADHTKFERPAFANFASLKDVDAVVSDKRPPPETVRCLKKNGIKLFFPRTGAEKKGKVENFK